jgi:S-(hydroxymethyl)glutathione dehydrogenase/alcohol dehydrogenase
MVRAVKAIVVHDNGGDARLEEVQVDGPRASEVLVRIAGSGVCGSDLHVLHGRATVATFPLVLGHEGAGVVEAVGPGVDGVAVGDHVVIALYGPCGHCAHCRSGDIVRCDGPERVAGMFGRMADGSTRVHQGSTALHPFVGIGSLAEYAVVRASQTVVVDPDLPLDVIALAGCGVTTGLGAVFNTARVAPGDRVAVVGCGGVGLNVIQGARLAGAGTIIAVDPLPAKLDLASDLGATHAVNSSEQPMRDAVSAIVPGGVDIAFEVVGDPELVAATFELTRPGGLCVMVGSPGPGSTIPVPGPALFMERRLAGCVGGSNVPARDIPRIVSLYQSGRLDLDRLVSQRLPIERFDDAVNAAEAGTVARSVITF